MSLKKIAEIVGTSVSTVSRVLNNPNYNCASNELRDKIWKTARELNYAPNVAAQNLKKGIVSNYKKNYCINILVTRASGKEVDPLFNEILPFLYNELYKEMCLISNVWHMPIFIRENNETDIQIKKACLDIKEQTIGKNDGLIIIGKCDLDAVEFFSKTFKAIIKLTRSSVYHLCDEVSCNGKRIQDIIVKYLYSLGHRKIAYIGNPDIGGDYKSYIEALQKRDIMPKMQYTLRSGRTEAGGYHAMEQILQMEELPTAIYCERDIIAIGALKYLKQNRNYYYNPSIISCDGINESQYTDPILTTYSLPKESMSRAVVLVLLDRLKGGHKNLMSVEIEGELLIRESCHSVEDTSLTEYYI